MGRKITIYLDTRSATDSPEILENIAKGFSESDLEVHIESNKDSRPKVEAKREEILEVQTSDTVKDALEENDIKHQDNNDNQENYDEKELILDKEKTENETKEFVKGLAEKGVIVTITTVLKKILEAFL